MARCSCLCEFDLKVIDHEPHAWFLLREDGALLLDVNCSHSAAGYAVMIQLSAEEESRYALEGRDYLDWLASAVQESGPGRGYQLRDVSAQYAQETTRAVEEWRALSGLDAE